CNVSTFDVRLKGLVLSQYGFYYKAGSLHYPVTVENQTLVYESHPGHFEPVTKEDLFAA
ncbi:hypothetical protein HDU98_005633, partial [Podochytrium sp. JEL0797]